MKVGTYEINDENPQGFFEAVKSTLSQEPKLNDVYLQELVLDITAEVKEIERWMAAGLAESAMEEIGEGFLFKVEDMESANGVGTTSLSLYNATTGAVKNWGGPFKSISDPGRYGGFFERLFFKGGAGDAPRPDLMMPIQYTQGRSAGKSAIVPVEVKTATIEKLGNELTGAITVGKKGGETVRQFYETIKSNPQKRAMYLRDVVAYKFLNKMQNFLVAGITKGLPGSKVENVPTTDGVWTKTTVLFFFTKLIYFFRLIQEKLIELIEQEITAEKMPSMPGKGKKTIGGLIEERRRENTSLERFEVKIKITRLPTNEDLANLVNRNAQILYTGRRTLYDDSSADFEKSKDFFKRIISEYHK